MPATSPVKQRDGEVAAGVGPGGRLGRLGRVHDLAGAGDGGDVGPQAQVGAGSLGLGALADQLVALGPRRVGARGQGERDLGQGGVDLGDALVERRRWRWPGWSTCWPVGARDRLAA